MKKSYHLILIAAFGILFNACKKEVIDKPVEDFGRGTFWIASDLGTVTVTCNGQTKTITQYYASGQPECGSTGCANFVMPSGTYPFTAYNTYGESWNGNIVINDGLCALMQLTSGGGSGSSGYKCNGSACYSVTNGADFSTLYDCQSYCGGGGSTNGKAAFWTSTNQGNISVTVNGTTRYITSYYSSGGVNCSSAGCAIFDLPPGTYSYTAENSTSTWNNTIAVTAGGCATVLLTGGGGGSSTGNLIVWIASDLGHGRITVRVSGQSSQITSYYYSGAPACGASGCANFTLPQGNYYVTAEAEDGTTWSDYMQVNNGYCSKLQLY